MLIIRNTTRLRWDAHKQHNTHKQLNISILNKKPTETAGFLFNKTTYETLKIHAWTNRLSMLEFEQKEHISEYE